ncbi:MAG: hypothetical protein COW84_00115 [Gammaproteobacteria bacterium CG22_combo_CG10-13_8_21_14_all_40_8]|nr:MAG: hypothetical protein COW84_00115 [Gammaproteobacteria bacterium CG22_combo_CG10-13_8_21_14_all_40_8]
MNKLNLLIVFLGLPTYAALAGELNLTKVSNPVNNNQEFAKKTTGEKLLGGCEPFPECLLWPQVMEQNASSQSNQNKSKDKAKSSTKLTNS